MTLRQHYAGLAMQGMVANPEIAKTGMAPDVWIRGCVHIADALIAELSKPQPTPSAS
jgi:hypothetical protein